MKFAKVTSGAIATLAILTAATYALPRYVNVERSAVVSAAPNDVLTLAASNQGYQVFNPYRDLDPALSVDMFGPSAGVGSGFHFDSKDGAGSTTISSVTADTVTYDIDLGPMGQPTQSIAAVETADGTAVTWRMEADMGFNPVFRIFGLFMDGMMGPTFELGLENIAKATA